MAVLVSEVLTEARQQLNDSTATYRWSDASLMLYMSRGVDDVYGDFPESFFIDGEKIPISAPEAITAVTEDFPLRKEYIEAIVHYICWKVFGEDTEDDGNIALSKDHAKQYMQARG